MTLAGIKKRKNDYYIYAARSLFCASALEKSERFAENKFRATSSHSLGKLRSDNRQ